MKLRDIILDDSLAGDRAFHAAKFEIDGKTVVKYTEDFDTVQDSDGNDVTSAHYDANYIKASETVQFTVPMPVIKAMGLDKKYASRRYLASDLDQEAKELIGSGRAKGALAALSLEVATLKTKALNKAKSGKLSKSGNTGLLFSDTDIDTFMSKLEDLNTSVSMAFVGGAEEVVIEDEF